ncbi:PREDICTED: sphingosine-1-phosphate phosphatase 1-like [Ceratosolen solmsi marchali]|uniref:Sphingosine-1-phosphate phosphatase 1-like n=1 Tax=Ceratosolen solmsi marchali TaxID=326594 RepID=A0AAJ6YLB9_9HYME|nr:PREDICTED: sphingosine-1-phosphate phosphatase 1-like [Ceratosolen solmsi marchali]XP_011500153.1 PREDICTED: sphingosine-1-phosphate phosphatase 1-like [Ceratosolen solmsi marchali]
MWSKFFQHYRDPYLVSRIQEFFGVQIHYNEHSKNKAINTINDWTAKNEKNSPANANSHLSKNGHVNHEIERTNNNHQNESRLNSDNASAIHVEDKISYKIKNYFWYYLFLFGTELGDEVFYLTFIPFWFWNIDGSAGRKIVLVWATIMSIGQALKDIICWPRPSSPPVARLQKKWSLEYGMPSTHAMIGVSIPFSVILFTMNKYNYSIVAGCIAAILWCSLICVSRIYLGMHTVLDVLVGLILSILLMILFVPLVNILDYYFLTNGWTLLAFVIISILIIIYYPRSDKWTPTRGDTTLVISVTAGVHVGAWLNYKTGAFVMPIQPPPYEIIWPSYLILGITTLRTIFGFCCVLGTKVICKTLTYNTMCAILQVNSKELMQSKDSLKNKKKILVDLVYKYITCFMIGFNIVYLLPNIFAMIGIERPTFYTE